MKIQFIKLSILVICGNLTGQDLSKIELESNKIISKTANESWTIVTDWEGLDKLAPEAVKSTNVTGKGIDSTWEIYLTNGGKIVEQMQYYNDNQKTMAYIMTETPMPIQDYYAIIKVEPYGIKKSMVSFYTSCKTEVENEKSIYTTFEAFQKNYLNNLEKLNYE